MDLPGTISGSSSNLILIIIVIVIFVMLIAAILTLYLYVKKQKLLRSKIASTNVVTPAQPAPVPTDP